MIFLEIGQNLGNSCSLDFDENLALCYRSQGLDDLYFSIDVGDVAEEVDDRLDHLLDGLFELAMFLG